MILLLDNYDSFTYNLYQYLGELGAEMRVVRNDAISVDEALALEPERIVISPGPGAPDSAGISVDLARAAAGRVPVLGVCLGHQSIGQALGARVVPAGELMHGKTSPMHHDGRGLFVGLASPFVATRYHSLLVERETLPDCFEVTAWTEDEKIMGIRHREWPLEGLQFHPESILTEVGYDLLRNFLRLENPDPSSGDRSRGDQSVSNPPVRNPAVRNRESR